MKKTLTVLLALVLVIAMSVAGTMAYLTSTAKVENTFSVGKVTITMDETDVDNSTADKERDTRNEYKLIPGMTYTKDPIIHVGPLSEDCYLFVKVVNGIKNYEATGETTIATQMAKKNWKLVDATNGIYVYAEGDAPKTAVAKESNVTVFESFTIADYAQLPESGNGLDVEVTAYAVQTASFETEDPADIWAAAGFNTTT